MPIATLELFTVNGRLAQASTVFVQSKLTPAVIDGIVEDFRAMLDGTMDKQPWTQSRELEQAYVEHVRSRKAKR